MVIVVLALLFITIILWDAFEVIVLPRRVTRRLRLARLFYRSTWAVWSGLAQTISNRKRRELVLGYYGPLSLLLLLGTWAAGLILSFAMLQWSLGPGLRVAGLPANFATDLYMSGTTFFTLGLGDVTPSTPAARLVTVAETGTGFGFLALVIGYIPVIYQAFSRREVNIALLDARAGSPPSAAELLIRHGRAQNKEALVELLRDWERWSADLLESHISYPVLVFFRSQHDNQSWLASLTTVLDTCALVIAEIDYVPAWQAQLTFAMARHAVVDLAQILNAAPRPPQPDRLPPQELKRLRNILAANGVSLSGVSSSETRLAELRHMYEPYVNALAHRLLFSLPLWLRSEKAADNWRTSAWERSSSGIAASPLAPLDDHSR